MSDATEDGDSARCCSGRTKWIWVALALILGVIVFSKFAGTGASSRCCAGTGPLTPAGSLPPAVVALATNLPRMVDLGATKCIPCKLMAPILEELKQTFAGRLEVQFIDVWVNPDEAPKYGVKIIPTQIFYDAAGKELFRHEGFFAREDILAKWKEFGVDLMATPAPAASVSP